jgi:lysophospholipase L1-like esterase
VPARGSRLLEGAERLLRRALERDDVLARRRQISAIEVDAAFEAGLFETELADDYRALVAVARKHGLALVLCTHPLAVNADSPEDVVRFYEAGFPDVRGSIELNRLHSKLVRAIGREQGVPVIDVLPKLDGAWRDAYIDLFHYTELGRERVAERMFEGLRPLLSAGPRPRCVPRAKAAEGARLPSPGRRRSA